MLLSEFPVRVRIYLSLREAITSCVAPGAERKEAGSVEGVSRRKRRAGGEGEARMFTGHQDKAAAGTSRQASLALGDRKLPRSQKPICIVTRELGLQGHTLSRPDSVQ